jgi:DNA repair protein RecO (recombination protein O)
MLYKTKGVVFKYFKYGDTSIIVKILTDQFGLQTYIVNGVRSSRAKSKIALYQPLTLLDMVVYHKPGSNINRISEIKCNEPFQSLPYEIAKSSIGVFIGEVLYKCIKEEGEVKDLYEFIHNSISVLDHLKEGYQNFHLQFLLKLSRHLGFGITSTDQFFLTLSSDVMSQRTDQLLESNYSTKVELNNFQRRELLEQILNFYKSHIDNMGEIKSIKILRTVLEDTE